MLNVTLNLILSVITLIYSADKLGDGADGLGDILMLLITIVMTGYNLDTGYKIWEDKKAEVEVLKETLCRR